MNGDTHISESSPPLIGEAVGSNRADDYERDLFLGRRFRDALDERKYQPGGALRRMRSHLETRLERLEAETEMTTKGSLARAENGHELATLSAGDADEALIDQIRKLQFTTLDLLGRAERVGRATTALQVIREARKNLELIARLTGQFETATRDHLVTAVVMMPTAAVFEREGMVLDVEPST